MKAERLRWLSGAALAVATFVVGARPAVSGTAAALVPGALPFHIVMLDQRGDVHGRDDMVQEGRPCGKDCPLDYDATPTSVDDYIKAQIAHLRAYIDKGSERNVVIYLHGGLNSRKDGIGRARDFYNSALASGVYPIFVNWRSGFPSSYADHLLNVRQGRYRRSGEPLGAWVAPAYVLGDVARIVGQAIPAIAQLAQNDFEGSIACPGAAWCQENPQAVVDRICNGGSQCPDPIHLSRVSMDKSCDGEAISGFLTWLFTYPAQLALAPLIAGLGTPSWDVMLRRTSVVFHRDEDFAFDDEGNPMTKGRTGGLARFLDVLSAEVARDGKPWEITLVGHSMGTIIANGILREYGTYPTDVVVDGVSHSQRPLPISNVVYMAAACTIKDYQDSAWHFLRSASQEGNPQIYHLMLHPKAEAQEWEGWSPVPRGSLLVWLDAFFTNPSTPLDLMAGRFTNLMRTIPEVPSAFQSRIHYTVFEKGAVDQPQTHGSFGPPVRFWDELCWDGTKDPKKWADICAHD